MNLGKGLATVGLALVAVVAVMTIIGMAVVPLILDTIQKIWRAET